MLNLAVEAFKEEKVVSPPAGPVLAVPKGESRDIHERGGRYIAMAGGQALFHLEQDRWPEAVNLNAFAGYARAFSRLAVTLGKEQIAD